MKQLPLAISLDDRASFSNTYVSKANQLLVNRLKHLSLNSHSDSIFLWGSKDSGLTHLLEAIQNAHQELAIQYLPLNLLKTYEPEEIISGVEAMDLVCIDDLEAIAGLAPWEQNLFHLFNRLKDADKPLIIASHTSARQLPLQLPDLKSRCQWLTLYKLHTLSDSEKMELLQYRAKNLGMAIADEVAYFLIKRISRSTHQLVELLEKLDRQSLAAQRKITIPFVKKILEL